MKKLVLLFLFILPLLAFSQSTGYAGKKLIVKTDALYGAGPGFRNIEAEYAITRRLSITAGARIYSGKYQQTVEEISATYIGNGARGSYQTQYPTSMPDVSISFSTFKGQLKWYPGHIIRRAPWGFYFGLGYEKGFANLTGGTKLKANIETTPGGEYMFVRSFNRTEDIAVKNIAIGFTEFSMGHQSIIKERFVLDINVAFNKTTFNTNGERPTLEVTTLVAPNFGPNVLAIGQKPAANEPYTGSYGLSAYVKIGYLF